nr:hypothetical protein [Tanacetum cinerariifolium]
MSTPTQYYLWYSFGSNEYAYSVLVMVPWERMGTPAQCDMLCGTFWVSLVAYRASYSNPECEIKCALMFVWYILGYLISEDLEEESIEKEPLAEPKEKG